MAQPWSIHRLQEVDLDAYKRLRDRSLSDYPDAFTSDASESAQQCASSYLGRLGLDRAEGGHFTLGIHQDTQKDRQSGELAGALSCERETRLKVHHIGHLTAMMVQRDCARQGIGLALLEAAVADARRATGLEMLTLSVTASNHAALQLYQRFGFVRYASLPNGIKVDGRPLTKDGMVLIL